MNSIRSLVSENRKRFVEEDVNLDLSYITARIIAMSYPSEGIEGLYRNPFVQVKRFLEKRHAGHYKVYNLRKEKQYDLSKFEHAANYPFLDHQAPPFELLISFCNDASDWLKAHHQNVVAIHCKAGKGRTGTMIAALLLHLGLAKTAQQAIEIYGEKRTDNANGLTIPSQIRYVHYYASVLKDEKAAYTRNKHITVTMTQMVIHDFPKSLNETFILCLFDSDNTLMEKRESTKMTIDRTSDTILIHTVIQLQNDFKVVFTNNNNKPLFAFWLNSVLVYTLNHNTVHLSKREIDLAFRDTACKVFDDAFSIGITFT